MGGGWAVGCTHMASQFALSRTYTHTRHERGRSGCSLVLVSGWISARIRARFDPRCTLQHCERRRGRGSTVGLSGWRLKRPGVETEQIGRAGGGGITVLVIRSGRQREGGTGREESRLGGGLFGCPVCSDTLGHPSPLSHLPPSSHIVTRPPLPHRTSCHLTIRSRNGAKCGSRIW